MGSSLSLSCLCSTLHPRTCMWTFLRPRRGAVPEGGVHAFCSGNIYHMWALWLIRCTRCCCASSPWGLRSRLENSFDPPAPGQGSEFGKMMGLRSTTDTGSPDTSLVTPSDKDLSSGQQRVLNQVNTIKRSKSKYKNGTTSPTSMETDFFELF